MNHVSAHGESKEKEAVEPVAKHPYSVFFKCGGKVYTEIVPDCAKATLQAIIRGRVAPESVVHSDARL